VDCHHNYHIRQIRLLDPLVVVFVSLPSVDYAGNSFSFSSSVPISPQGQPIVAYLLVFVSLLLSRAYAPIACHISIQEI